MTAVTDYLAGGGTLAALAADHAIEVVRHPSEPLAILNYHQFRSDRTHPLVRACRGLTVETTTGRVVARSFPRFFNLGELPAEDAAFDWSNFTATDKADGSLMILFNYEGRWRVNTRGSFADSVCGQSGRTWAKLFWQTIGGTAKQIDCVLSPNVSYSFEFCSPYNTVVAQHAYPELILLAAFDTATGVELDEDAVWMTASELGVREVVVRHLKTMADVRAWVGHEQHRADYEGVVIRDRHGRRLKVKNPAYVALHRLNGNGNLANPKNLLPYVLATVGPRYGADAGEFTEVLAYLPHVRPAFDALRDELQAIYVALEAVWTDCRDLVGQKEFAQAILPRTPLAALLFTARKTGRPLFEVWCDSPAIVLKAYESATV